MQKHSPKPSLSGKQQAFVDAYIRHPHGATAAKDAGYHESAAGRLLAHPTIAAEVERRRAVLRDTTDYDVKAAMRELETGIDISRSKGQMMAYMKGVELRAKLMGLLIEKLDVRQMTNFRINILGLPDVSEAASTSLINVDGIAAVPLALNPSREVGDTSSLIDDAQFEEDIFGL